MLRPYRYHRDTTVCHRGTPIHDIHVDLPYVWRANASPLQVSSWYNGLPSWHANLRHSRRKTMKFDPDRHHRRSIRLRGYDYRQAGTYFVTICTHHRECTLGAIHNRKVNLSPIGQIAERCWCALPEHFTFVDLDAFVIMPNHLHGIINIKDRGSGTMTALDDARTLAPAKGTQAASLA